MTAETPHVPKIVHQQSPAPLSWPVRAVAVADHGGIPEWYCHDCRCWHPIYCPNGPSPLEAKSE